MKGEELTKGTQEKELDAIKAQAKAQAQAKAPSQDESEIEASTEAEMTEAPEASEVSKESEESEEPEASEAPSVGDIEHSDAERAEDGDGRTDTVTERSKEEERSAYSAPSVPVSGDVGDLHGDLFELISAFPELYGTERLEDLPKYARYRALRAQGLTPQEAYYASNGDEIVRYRLDADRRREQRAQTSHLTSIVGQSEISERIMSESEKRAARIALGYSISDAELERLWKRIHSGGEETV